jgi:sodium/potassium-transporting ATPase subunit alpha
MQSPAQLETGDHLQVPGSQALGRGEPDRDARFRSMSRASSRSSHRRIPKSSSYLGIPVEYRTLSLRASERRRAEQDVASDLKPVHQEERDYFANIAYHQLDLHELCQQLAVAPLQGLSHTAVDERLERDGDNVLPEPKSNYGKTLLFYTFGGFCSILWVGVIVFFICWRPLSDPPSPTYLALSVLIIIVITLQAGFSSFQDWSTSRTMRSVLDLIPSETLVMRNGNLQFVPSMDLVAGDIVHLNTGCKVPADIRLVNHSGDLRFDRAAITGEADEIEASLENTSPNYLESRNIALMGTIIVNGSGMGVVVLTGHRSVMGRIAHAMSSIKEKSTLIQREIWRFVRIIVVLTIGLVLLFATSWAGWLRIYHREFMGLVSMLSNRTYIFLFP